jgi:hypothetical protein
MGLFYTADALKPDPSPMGPLDRFELKVECCQCGNVASFNVANFQLDIGIGYWQHFHIGNINLIGRARSFSFA